MFDAVASLAEKALVQGCWRQWRAVMGEGVYADERPVRSIVDPEALVAASLAMRNEEHRLRDLLYWWAQHGTRLLSVQRLRTTIEAFPEELSAGVSWFASLARDAGDARWKRLASERTVTEPTRAGKGPRELHLLEPATLMLQLRAGFGVGAKADLMAFLLGAGSPLRRREISTTIKVASEAISYSRASVARAAKDMSLARFIEESADRPPLYSLEAEAWGRVLHLRYPDRPMSGPHDAPVDPPDVPPWRFWGQVFAFLVAAAEWARNSSEGRNAPVVSASRARDLVERFGKYLAWNGIELPYAPGHAGERYLEPFCGLVEQVARRVDEDL